MKDKYDIWSMRKPKSHTSGQRILLSGVHNPGEDIIQIAVQTTLKDIIIKGIKNPIPNTRCICITTSLDRSKEYAHGGISMAKRSFLTMHVG